MTKHENGLPTIFIDNLFQFMTFLGLFFALLYGAYGLVFLTLLLLFMVNGSKLWCRLSLMHLHCRLSVDKKKVFPGEEFSLKAEVTNGKILPVSVQLQLSLDKTLLEETISESSALLWFQKVIWQWELQAKRRGCYKLGPSQLYAGDLFGFFQRQKEFKPLEELIVYPRLLPINELPLPLQELLGSKEVNSPV
ncbi:MAG: hypothetical protein GX764_01675, partial [Firmicutes bacterium]|nr:hypothetical protein [Bacillota bacterium]